MYTEPHPLIADLQAWNLEAGNLNIHYVPGACARNVSKLHFYFTKDYFNIIIVFVGDNDF